VHHCSPRAAVVVITAAALWPPSVVITAAALWAPSVAAIWLPVDGRLLPTDRAAAVAYTVLAGTGLMLRGMVRDRVVRHLADAAISSRRAVRLATGPHRAPRDARGLYGR
jgi:hypothetical protein